MLANLVGPDTGIVLLVVIVVMLFGGSRLAQARSWPRKRRAMSSARDSRTASGVRKTRATRTSSSRRRRVSSGDNGAETIDGVKEGTEQEAS